MELAMDTLAPSILALPIRPLVLTALDSLAGCTAWASEMISLARALLPSKPKREPLLPTPPLEISSSSQALLVATSSTLVFTLEMVK